MCIFLSDAHLYFCDLKSIVLVIVYADGRRKKGYPSSHSFDVYVLVCTHNIEEK